MRSHLIHQSSSFISLIRATIHHSPSPSISGPSSGSSFLATDALSFDLAPVRLKHKYSFRIVRKWFHSNSFFTLLTGLSLRETINCGTERGSCFSPSSERGREKQLLSTLQSGFILYSEQMNVMLSWCDMDVLLAVRGGKSVEHRRHSVPVAASESTSL